VVDEELVRCVVPEVGTARSTWMHITIAVAVIVCSEML